MPSFILLNQNTTLKYQYLPKLSFQYQPKSMSVLT